MILHHKKLLIHKIVSSFRWVHTFLRIDPKACFWLWSTLYVIQFIRSLNFCCLHSFYNILLLLFYILSFLLCFIFIIQSPKIYFKKIFNSYLIFHHKNIQINRMKEIQLFIKWCVRKLALNQDCDNVVWNEIPFGMK